MSSEQNPLVTIIALCYNHEQYLEQTLNSIQSQSYPNIELIVIDDASSDRSKELIKAWISQSGVQCTFIDHKENLGICKSLNQGLEMAKGKYYQAISCDDMMLSHKIDTQVASLEGNPDYAFVYSDAYFMNQEGRWWPFGGKFIQTNVLHYSNPPLRLFEMLILEKNFIPAPAVLIRKEFVDEIGRYDENISYEDYDLWLRLSAKYKAFFMDEPNCLYRLHESNMTQTLRISNVHLVSQFEILHKHIRISKALDAAIEIKLYIVLKQLFYNNFTDIKRFADRFYSYFNKDENLKIAIRLPFGNKKAYRFLSRTRAQK